MAVVVFVVVFVVVVVFVDVYQVAFVVVVVVVVVFVVQKQLHQTMPNISKHLPQVCSNAKSQQLSAGCLTHSQELYSALAIFPNDFVLERSQSRNRQICGVLKHSLGDERH